MGIGSVMEPENLSLVTMHQTIGRVTVLGKSSVTVTRDYVSLTDETLGLRRFYTHTVVLNIRLLKNNATAMLKKARDVGSGTELMVARPLKGIPLSSPNDQLIVPLRFGVAEIIKVPL